MPAIRARISSVSRLDTYRATLRTPGAAGFVIAGAVGRIGIAMTSLGIVLLVHWSSGSFGIAGTVTGGFAVAEAGIGPQTARLIDRFGQTRVLPFSLIAHAAAIALLVILAANDAAVWELFGAGVLAGATIPQLGALTAARWSWLLNDSPLLTNAFALESLSNGIAYLVGPALVGTVSTTLHPAAGPIFAATLLVGGGAVLVGQRRTTPAPAERLINRPVATLRHRGFAVLVAVNLGLGLYFGSMQVSITGFALVSGVPSAAGPLNSLSSATSLVAGLLYGLRRGRWKPATQLAGSTALLCIGCLPVFIHPTLPVLITSLMFSGLMLAPTLILLGLLTQALIDRSVLTQAFTWQNSASAAGSAIAAALAGYIVDTHGPQWSFGIAFVSTAVMAALTFRTRQALAGQ